MVILSVQRVGKSFGGNKLFEEVTFEVQHNDKIGLIGVNGCGKTTLLKIVTGFEEADEGVVAKNGDLKIGVMEQQVIRDNETVYDEGLRVFEELARMEEELSQINIKIDSYKKEVPHELLESQMWLQQRYEDGGGLTYRSRTRATLLGLGFREAELTKRVQLLSGGEKSKLQLAKLLLSDAGLLLLDEPTNHLDLAAYGWLEKYLSDYRGALLVISHDRYFLDRITGRTVEIENRRITSYQGNYSEFLKKKEKAREAALKKYQQTAAEINRIEKIIEQQRRWNQAANYVTIAHKQKSIDRLTETLEKPEESPEALKFSLHPKEIGGNDVLMAEGLSFGFSDKELFTNAGISLRRGERAFLLGANGAGKTTFFKCLMNHYTPRTGVVTFGSKVSYGYYDQVQNGLSGGKTVLNELWDSYPKLTETAARSALGRFLFKGEQVFKEVGLLSGGEKARLALLKLMLSGANLLFLDEPTNHLDMHSREALENALLDYGGTMLIISHDRYLINKLATVVYELSAKGLTRYDGNYEYYLEKKEAAADTPKATVKSSSGDAYRKRRERERELRVLSGKIERVLVLIEGLEGELKDISAKMEDSEVMSDYQEAIKLAQRHQVVENELEAAIGNWESLSIQLENLKKQDELI